MPGSSATPQKEQAMSVMEATFTPQCITQLSHYLLSNFLALNPEEIMETNSDPESAIFESAENRHGYRCTKAAEEVVVALCMMHHGLLMQTITKVFNEASSVASRESAVMKDAALQALRLGILGLDTDVCLPPTLILTLIGILGLDTDICEAASLYNQGLHLEFSAENDLKVEEDGEAHPNHNPNPNPN